MSRISIAIVACLLIAYAANAQNPKDLEFTDRAWREHYSQIKRPFYCPVVGMPEANSCCCPRTPFTYNGRIYCTYEPGSSHTVEHRGGRLQLCCKECEKLFKATPAKFAVAANHQLVATNQARQVKCPLTGKPNDPGIFTEVSGIRVFFASADSKKTIDAASPLVRNNLVFDEQGFARGFEMTPKWQRYCPVAGPGPTYFPRLGECGNLTVEHKGARVPMCCELCQAYTFKKAPALYAAFANHQIVVTKQARQVACPLTGKLTDPKLFADVADVRVYLATEESERKVAAATSRERFNLVFGDAAFARAFVVKFSKP